MQSLLFALISYVGWGTGDVFGTIASRKIGGYSTTFWAYLFGLIIFSFYVPFARGDLKGYTPQLIFINLGIGILSMIANVALNEGLRVGNPSLVGTIAAAFTGITVVLSILFLHEKVTLIQTYAIILIFAGVILSSLDFKTLRDRKSVLNRGVIFALIAMVFWGIFFTGTKALSKDVGWFWPQYFTFALCPLIYVYLKISKQPFVLFTKKGVLKHLLLSASLLRAGDFSFQFALSRGAAAIAAPIAGSFPTLFAVLSFFVFRERLTKQQICGIVVTLLGIVLLSMFTA